MAPVYHALAGPDKFFEVKICVTAQHREMLDQVLQIFNIAPDYDLDVMKSSQDLVDTLTLTASGLKPVIRGLNPDLVLVHGDTTTACAAGIACFYEKIPVGHVEAGLRTASILAPWPEEFNRRVVTTCSEHHFAPTELARENLRAEGVASNRIVVTGNTVVDALRYIEKRLEENENIRAQLRAKFGFLANCRRLLLVTGHRRESHDYGLAAICSALSEALERDPDLTIVFPVHPHPIVTKVVDATLGNAKTRHPSRLFLIKPLDYVDFVFLMKKSDLILTDSGGIQEEATALGKDVLVTREVTERPEAVNAGFAKLVGTKKDQILRALDEAFSQDPTEAKRQKEKNPFGDGNAALKIREYLNGVLGG